MYTQPQKKFRARNLYDVLQHIQSAARGLGGVRRLFLAHLELNKTIFRSDHASNYLVLKGTLGRDKQKMLDQVNLAITNPGAAPLRAEWMRGL